MSFYLYNIFGFFIFLFVAIFAWSKFKAEDKNRKLLVLFWGVLTVWPGYLAYYCAKCVWQGDLYVAETKEFVKDELKDSRNPTISLGAIRYANEALGFKLEKTDVKNIWNGKADFKGNSLPYNAYEVNTKWKNRSEGESKELCFLFAYANDIENDYRRLIRVEDDCNNKDNWLSIVKKDAE
ncbi:hypothetical protein [Pantoea septica]|uniref:hypothetical protein n=1 Tax=Pantoea septica TaxID=472695 RepID=UPI0028A09772|nr:hypothetical protein [Pantoea septica]